MSNHQPTFYRTALFFLVFNKVLKNTPTVQKVTSVHREYVNMYIAHQIHTFCLLFSFEEI